MIVTRYYSTRQDGTRLVMVKSDSGFYLTKPQNTDILYTYVIDVEDTTNRYIETEEKIPDYQPIAIEEDNWEQEAEEAYQMGVNEA